MPGIHVLAARQSPLDPKPTPKPTSIANAPWLMLAQQDARPL